MIKKRNVPIKSLLLDQSFSAGIGNWIADEVLYQAKVHPYQYTRSLIEEEFEALHKSITDVIGFAVKVNADSDLFPKSWLFHYRWFKGKRNKKADKDGDGDDGDAGKPKMPDGNLIVFDSVGSRTTAIVPAVQVLRGDKSAGKGKRAKGGNAGKKRKKADVDQEEDNDDDAGDEEEKKPKKSPKGKGSKGNAGKKRKKTDLDDDEDNCVADDDAEDRAEDKGSEGKKVSYYSYCISHF
ncbi:hypothetical protein HDU76_011391 [Blyttiomyces sp. JEL0837]|nr:hypothetical protein HDU76_011391 [Blyttiomyces sp. JEL0837]